MTTPEPTPDDVDADTLTEKAERQRDEAEARVKELEAENDVLHEDVMRFITQRNLVCEALAARIIPGPDGQDDIDRRRLIQEVSEDAWDDVAGWQELAAKGATVVAERDRLAARVKELEGELADMGTALTSASEEVGRQLVRAEEAEAKVRLLEEDHARMAPKPAEPLFTGGMGTARTEKE